MLKEISQKEGNRWKEPGIVWQVRLENIMKLLKYHIVKEKRVFNKNGCPQTSRIGNSIDPVAREHV